MNLRLYIIACWLFVLVKVFPYVGGEQEAAKLDELLSKRERSGRV